MSVTLSTGAALGMVVLAGCAPQENTSWTTPFDEWVVGVWSCRWPEPDGSSGPAWEAEVTADSFTVGDSVYTYELADDGTASVAAPDGSQWSIALPTEVTEYEDVSIDVEGTGEYDGTMQAHAEGQSAFVEFASGQQLECRRAP